MTGYQFFQSLLLTGIMWACIGICYNTAHAADDLVILAGDQTRVLVGDQSRVVTHSCPGDASGYLMWMAYEREGEEPSLHRARDPRHGVPYTPVGSRYRLAFYCNGEKGAPDWSRWYEIGPAFDPNHNGAMDNFDYRLISAAWGSVIGDDRYNPWADLNSDGAVTPQDIALWHRLKGLCIVDGKWVDC